VKRISAKLSVTERLDAASLRVWPTRPSTASSGSFVELLDRAGVVAGLEGELGLEPADPRACRGAALQVGEQRARSSSRAVCR